MEDLRVLEFRATFTPKDPSLVLVDLISRVKQYSDLPMEVPSFVKVLVVLSEGLDLSEEVILIVVFKIPEGDERE